MRKRMNKIITSGILITGLFSLNLEAKKNSQPAITIETRGSIDSVKKTILDLKKTFGKKYPKADEYLSKLEGIRKLQGEKAKEELIKLQKEAMLANPLLDFDKILVIKRPKHDALSPAFCAYQINVVTPNRASEIMVLSDLRNGGKLTPLFKLPNNKTISQMDLNFDADKILFAGGTDLPGKTAWQVYEINLKDKKLERLTKEDEIEAFDPMYLADGNILYNSTAAQQGLPCESGRILNSNIYKMFRDTNKTTRLTFDQDSDWGETMMENGRVMFLRWEYSDLAHMFSRILMIMNPDGTGQLSYYGSNSYWPNSMMEPKPIPGSPNKFVTVVSGHHVPWPGTLAVFDVSKGRAENKGLITEIPSEGAGPTERVKDYLYNNRYPKCSNPYPLGKGKDDGAGRYFLVSAKLAGNGKLGIYLADINGNFTLIKDTEADSLNEPIPFVKKKKPPVIPDRVNPNAKDATVYIQNIYTGPGLKKIPKGTVKKLRLFTYHFAYGKVGGHDAIGIESSWDVKIILGTTPVYPDGSAMFKIPANMPVAIQPLDENNQSLQLMRSWFIGKPGEVVSCIGCHEDLNMTPPVGISQASRSKPKKLEPWYGKARGFSFLREVQPVLDKKCISCHNGKPREDGKILPNFDDTTNDTVDYLSNNGPKVGGPFPKSYIAISPYLRRPGPESDIHLLEPMEYHASTSYLIQKLKRGHHGVKISNEEWDRFATWIDLNLPCHGTYTEAQKNWANSDFHWAGSPSHEKMMENMERGRAIRNKLMKKYGVCVPDTETEAMTDEAIASLRKNRKPIMPKQQKRTVKVKNIPNWPFSEEKAKEMQNALGQVDTTVKVGPCDIKLKHIPAGQFIMGRNNGENDELPRAVKIEKPFWMTTTEVTNKLYKQFNSEHVSGLVDALGKDHGGYFFNVNGDNYPVIRISWNEANQFCKWLSEKTGKKFRLPTESEWEWAARAGTNTDFFYGNAKTDFSKYANLADATMKKFDWRATHNYMMRRDDVNDQEQYMATRVYAPNAFGLSNMIGNVAEWTSSIYKFKNQEKGKLVISKGGSWRDMPRWVPVASKVPYRTYQKVFNVGIRLVMEE